VEKGRKNQSGQSIVEYAVVLALIGILVLTVLWGVGKRSQASIAEANSGLQESGVAGGTGGSGGGPKPAGAAH